MTNEIVTNTLKNKNVMGNYKLTCIDLIVLSNTPNTCDFSITWGLYKKIEFTHQTLRITKFPP